jgi:hypothetical protein
MRLTKLIEGRSLRFRSRPHVSAEVKVACLANPAVAEFRELGRSEEGRPVEGVVLGTGNKHVTLVAGAHADEPVGPETLQTFVLEVLRDVSRFHELLREFRFFIVPHVNPDGEVRNATWIRRWPNMESYIAEAVRELPGADIEFGYPSMRAENRAVSAFLREAAPVVLHMSLHGMGFAEGAMLLIERRWSFRTQALRTSFARSARLENVGLHDHNRKGEKGFFYIEPGFATTPEGEAMRHYFRALGEASTAELFHDSSMEYVVSLGGDPLCLVTEVPLFAIDPGESHSPGVPERYLSFREDLAGYRLKPDEDRLRQLTAKYNIRPVELRSMIHLQLRAIELGLRAVAPA